MNIIETGIDGLVLIEPQVFEDNRGYFFESFSIKKFEDKVGGISFLQDNESKSDYGVLRGLHFQKPPFAQSKLVRVVKGKVLDVVVDIRTNSATYGKHFSVELTEENKLQLFVPRGFAHGFLVLSDNTIFQYKCDNLYNKESEGAIAWNDPDLNIDWKIDASDLILSDKDKINPPFKSLESLF